MKVFNKASSLYYYNKRFISYIQSKENEFRLDTLIKKVSARTGKRIYPIYALDKVIVTEGQFRGKMGTVQLVSNKAQKIKIKGVNLQEHIPSYEYLRKNYEKNLKSGKQHKKTYFPQYIPLKIVKLISPHAEKPIIPELKNGTRYCPITDKEIPLPVKKPYKSYQIRNKNYKDGEKDTSEENVKIITYDGADFSATARAFLDRMANLKKQEEKLIMNDKFKIDF